jgi:hypothetical protein
MKTGVCQPSIFYLCCRVFCGDTFFKIFVYEMKAVEEQSTYIAHLFLLICRKVRFVDVGFYNLYGHAFKGLRWQYAQPIRSDKIQ